MKLSEKITLLRKKAGLSQEELADKLNVSRQAVYKWEADIAKPELEKISAMVKVFNVSYDYLMNDGIVSLDMVSSPTCKKQFEFQAVFNTGVKLAFDQFDIDHGYTEKSKFSHRDSDEVFQSRKSVALKNIKEIGATHIQWLSKNATTTAFFYNEHTNVFGFYYGDQVQFACPIENYVGLYSQQDSGSFVNSKQTQGGVVFGNGGISGVAVGTFPYTEYIPSTSSILVLKYRDRSEIKEFKLVFNVCANFIVDQGKTEEAVYGLYNIHLKWLSNSFEELKLWFENIQSTIDDIFNGIKQATVIDSSFFREKNIKFAAEHSQYLTSIIQSVSKNNIKGYVKIAIIISVAIAAVIGLIVLFFKNVNIVW